MVTSGLIEGASYKPNALKWNGVLGCASMAQLEIGSAEPYVWGTVLPSTESGLVHIVRPILVKPKLSLSV